MQRSALCRSRRELSNAYFLAKFGFDTAENEPFQVCPLSAYRSPRSMGSSKDLAAVQPVVVDGVTKEDAEEIPDADHDLPGDEMDGAPINSVVEWLNFGNF